MNAILQKNRLSFADFCRKFITSHCKSDVSRNAVDFLFVGKPDNFSANPFQQPTGLRNALAGVTGISRFYFTSNCKRDNMSNPSNLFDSINDLSPDEVSALLAFIDAYKRCGASEILHVSQIQSGQTFIFFCIVTGGNLGDLRNN